jgi:hypothetical protein
MNDYERFMSKVNKTDTCWLWKAGLNHKQYGQFSITLNGWTKTYRAHRFIYEYFNGPIPEGMLVCHSCDVPGCVNPDHLWLGTVSDNAIDAVNKKRHGMTKKTHCPRGHEYTPENTYRRANRASASRECRKCRRIKNQEYYEKRKQYV